MPKEISTVLRTLQLYISCSTLTSYKQDGHHELEDTVDEWECKHDLQLSRAEGQLDNGAAQLGVLETRLQCNGSASEQREC